ncbi:MAG: MauE/DoxX family redox-associated membrane protein [Desulfatitalea sp.]
MVFRSKIKWAAFEPAARFLLGAIFIYAAVDKILDPATFAQAIANYQILPPLWVHPTALLLPWLELVCGLGLMSGVLKRGSALVITLLLITFTAALGYSAYRGLDIHCGCFASDGAGTPNLYLDLLRDAVLLTLAIFVLRRVRRSEPCNCPDI